MAISNLTTEHLSELTSEKISSALEVFKPYIEEPVLSDEKKDEFRDKFCEAWPAIKKGLIILKFVTPDNVDRVIDAVIALGDSICG